MFSWIKKSIPKGVKYWLRGWTECFLNRLLLEKTQKHYRELEKTVFSKNTISVASYVVFDSTFAADDLMTLWIRDSRFNPKIVIIPDVTRGRDVMLSQYERTKHFFIEKYGAEYVVDGYDIENDKFLDPSDNFDIVYMANSYDGMVNCLHSITYLSTKNVLPFIINYCYFIGFYSYIHIIQSLEQSLCWKVFTETRYTHKAYRKYQFIHGKNTVLSGYSKMDALACCEKKADSKKTIIIAPHHTVNADSLPLSNFLSYYKLIQDLPSLYPDVHFVFRPHPLLFTNLVNGKIWTQEQVDSYLTDLQNKGIEYSYSGGYMPLFKNSDALIHDCGSFLVEYLFTGNPCCFVSKKDNKKFINPFGMKCLSQHYRAWSEKDILSFIDDVVSGKRKPSPMPAWFRKNVAVNYPNASAFIYEHLLEPVK